MCLCLEIYPGNISKHFKAHAFFLVFVSALIMKAIILRFYSELSNWRGTTTGTQRATATSWIKAFCLQFAVAAHSNRHLSEWDTSCGWNQFWTACTVEVLQSFYWLPSCRLMSTINTLECQVFHFLQVAKLAVIIFGPLIILRVTYRYWEPNFVRGKKELCLSHDTSKVDFYLFIFLLISLCTAGSPFPFGTIGCL